MSAAPELRAWVRQHVAVVAGIDPATVDLHHSFQHHGLDSIDAVLMAGELEEVAGVEIDPVTFLLLPSLEAMIEAVWQLAAKATLTPGPSPAGAGEGSS